MLICFGGILTTGHAQAAYTVKATTDIDVKLRGTSTLHDWEMNAIHTSGEADFVFKTAADKELVAIKNLSFTIQVKDLKSDNDGLNKNAYEALKADKHKEICYLLTSSTLTPENGGYLIKSTGKLTIAGVSKVIYMDVHCVLNKNGTVTYRGSYKLKMTDYNVKPPSFMWGAMTTGDAMSLDFVVVYEK